MITYALSAKGFANNLLEHIVDPIIIFLSVIALGLLLFMGIVFMFQKEDSTKRKDLIKRLSIIVLGIFIIFSVWSIYKVVSRLAGADTPAVNIIQSSG